MIRRTIIADSISKIATKSHLINIRSPYCSKSSLNGASFKPNHSDSTRINKVSDTFHGMLAIKPPPSIINFNRLLGSAVKMRHYSLAVYMFDELRHRAIPLDECTLNISVNFYIRLSRVDLGMAVLAMFYKRGFAPGITTFSPLLRGLFYANMADEAELLFKNMLVENVCKPDKLMYNTVIHGLCITGNVLTAQELIVRLEQGSGCKPDLYSYNTVIWTLCDYKMIDDALRLFNRMSERGIRPDVLTYRLLIKGLCITGHVLNAHELIVRMEQGSGCKPDLYSYNTVIRTLFDYKLVDDALRLFNGMSEMGVRPNVLTYRLLIIGLYRLGRWNEASNLLNEMPYARTG